MLCRLLTFAAMVVALASPAWAQQETATVLGTVTDAQSAGVPGATVTARNVDTGFTRSAVSDQEGRYRIAALPPGSYELRSELQGFATAVRQGVILTVGAEAVLNFSMSVAGLSEAVTVIADTPVIETTTSAVQETIRRDQIDLLPLAGRDYTAVLRLVPGAAANNASYGFGGGRGRSNAWHVDGVDNSDEISGFAHQSPALDSIQEIQILVNGFKAEYGQASGGVINVITRSGTNQVLGSGLLLFQDEALRARSPYADRAQPEDPFQRIQYGATVGGPLRRDKMHYFATYEREDRDTASITTGTYPASGDAFAPVVRQFLTSNNIDLGLFGAGGRQRYVRPESVDVHKATGRVDYQRSATQNFTVRYTLDSNDQPSGTSGTIFDYNGGRNFLRTNYTNLNHKWILGDNKLNEAYIQYGNHHEKINANFTTFPTLAISGAFTLGSGTNFNPVDNHVIAINDNLTWSLANTRTGEHVMKMGAQIKVLRSDSRFDSNFRGTYTFPNLNDFLAGRPSRYTANQGDSRLKRPNESYGVFVQDDWRPTANLTINMGLRYDYESAKTQALVDVIGEPGPGISGDRNNLSPRLGFAWSPAGDTRQVIYGGTGVYYDQVILNIIGNARFTPPKVIGIQIDNPTFPDPFAGGTVSIPAVSVSIIDPELVTPRNWNSQIGYRRELAANVGLDVAFVYNRGDDHVGIINTNAGRPGSASSTGANPVRPDPTFINKSFYTNYGEIRYKGLLVDLSKRFSKGLQGGVAYTLSKTENNSFNFVSGLQVPTQPELSWGPDNEDRRHRLEAHAEINLPFGFQIGTIVDFRTEAPLDVFANGRDLNGDGITGDWVNESTCLPRTGVVACPGFNYSRNSVRELSTEDANRLRALFGQSAVTEFANNPKFFNLDATLQKRFPIGRHGLRLTVEAFNALNVPQRTAPNAQILNGLFGSYTAVTQPRAVQFTMQYDF
ncbi:MAG TPA: TonB-dependent receptor [Vicinamibacterales bacterium]|nr:TonB-dependent receptor [Vicinamibacterales bacterium]